MVFTENKPQIKPLYYIGEEIRGFPTEEMSLTIDDNSTSQTANMPGLEKIDSQNKYVIITVSIHNIIAQEINFDQDSEFRDRFVHALKTFKIVLDCGPENTEVESVSGQANAEDGGYSLNWGLGINIPYAPRVKELSPSQVIYGNLYFVINQNQTANSIICKQDNAAKPLFTVILERKNVTSTST